MKFPDYGKCQIRSVHLARQLENEGLRPIVLYGIFKPLTPRHSWDERWQKVGGDEFLHFWLAFHEMYYDYSCFQFGETSPIRTTRQDKRYEELGMCDIETGKLTHTGSMWIEWESLQDVEGVPVLKLVPIFV